MQGISGRHLEIPGENPELLYVSNLLTRPRVHVMHLLELCHSLQPTGPSSHHLPHGGKRGQSEATVCKLGFPFRLPYDHRSPLFLPGNSVQTNYILYLSCHAHLTFISLQAANLLLLHVQNLSPFLPHAFQSTIHCSWNIHEAGRGGLYPSHPSLENKIVHRVCMDRI